MAEIYGLRVADLLPERLHLADTMRAEVDEDKSVRASGFHWGLIGDQAEAALRSVLDCDLFEVLAAAWMKVRTLPDYADPARHPPGQTAFLSLTEHKFVRDLHPVLEMWLGPAGPYRLRFTLSLAAHFDGAILSIRDRHVVAVRPGEAWVGAQLKYGGVSLTREGESKRYKLRGEWTFPAPGIRIQPRAPSSPADMAPPA